MTLTIQSKMTIGGTALANIIELSYDDAIPGPIVVALHPFSDIYQIAVEEGKKARRDMIKVIVGI